MAFLASLEPGALPVVHPIQHSVLVLFLQLAPPALHLHLYLVVLVEVVDDLIRIHLPLGDAIAVIVVNVDAFG